MGFVDLASQPELNFWLVVFGTIGSFVGILGFILYLWGLKYKRAYWTIATTPVIMDSVSQIAGLDIGYAGRKIANFYRTDIRFWNAGTEPIRANDIAAGDPLRVDMDPGIELYNVSMPKTNHHAPKVELITYQDRKLVEFSFDFLEPKQGLTFSIFHGVAESGDFKLVGTLIGAKIIKINTEPRSAARPIRIIGLVGEEVIHAVLSVLVTMIALVVLLGVRQISQSEVLSFVVATPVLVGGMALARRAARFMNSPLPIPPGL